MVKYVFVGLFKLEIYWKYYKIEVSFFHDFVSFFFAAINVIVSFAFEGIIFQIMALVYNDKLLIRKFHLQIGKKYLCK